MAEDKLEKYRCTRGHEWESATLDSIGIKWPLFEIDDHYCALCIRDFCREYLGRVKKVS